MIYRNHSFKSSPVTWRQERTKIHKFFSFSQRHFWPINKPSINNSFFSSLKVLFTTLFEVTTMYILSASQMKSSLYNLHDPIFYLGYIPLTILCLLVSLGDGPAALEINTTIKPLVWMLCLPSYTKFLITRKKTNIYTSESRPQNQVCVQQNKCWATGWYIHIGYMYLGSESKGTPFN